MGRNPSEVTWVGQGAGCWLQKGLADVEGGGVFGDSPQKSLPMGMVMVPAESSEPHGRGLLCAGVEKCR